MRSLRLDCPICVSVHILAEVSLNLGKSVKFMILFLTEMLQILKIIKF